MSFDYNTWKKERRKSRRIFQEVEDLCLSISSKEVCEDKDEIKDLRKKLEELPRKVRPSLNLISVKLFAEQLANNLGKRSL